ncbi:unnamed protein product [Cuscuta campestris]|uniref:Uncharacterized protein n=1 Tax=Cuscuta campestris TaxID=132261 RepID=A0A484KH89_9ASTE|nr:unnamed protein product [Cuscuta campestris]
MTKAPFTVPATVKGRVMYWASYTDVSGPINSEASGYLLSCDGGCPPELELLRVCRPFVAPPATTADDHHSSGQAAALFSCVSPSLELRLIANL